MTKPKSPITDKLQSFLFARYLDHSSPSWANRHSILYFLLLIPTTYSTLFLDSEVVGGLSGTRGLDSMVNLYIDLANLFPGVNVDSDSSEAAVRTAFDHAFSLNLSHQKDAAIYAGFFLVGVAVSILLLAETAAVMRSLYKGYESAKACLFCCSSSDSDEDLEDGIRRTYPETYMMPPSSRLPLPSTNKVAPPVSTASTSTTSATTTTGPKSSSHPQHPNPNPNPQTFSKG